MAANSFSEEENLQKQDASSYQDINQSNRPNRMKNWSVYGESHYLATGVCSKGPWDPSSLKGISSYPPEADHDLTLEDFLNNYDEILPRISNTPVEERNPEHVKFLLHTVFPHLETKIAKSGRTADILNIILKLSCVKQCPVITRYALHMILETLSKTSYDSGGMFNDFLLKCESCLRDSLLDISIFDYENAEDQGLRIFVYSRSLMILYANIVQGTIPSANISGNFEVLLDRLCDLEEQIFFEEKDKPRYAISCIKETIARLSQTQVKRKKSEKSFYTFLKWLREYNGGGQENKDQRDDSVKHYISEIKTSRKGWYDFHAAVFCLGSQVHEKPKNREVLRVLVENYIKQHSVFSIQTLSSEGEWQTGLVLGSVLEDIVKYNHDRATRTLACLCLIYCFNKLTRRKSLAKTWLQKSLRRCLYGPNRELRELILKHLEMEGKRKERNEDFIRDEMDEDLPITQSMEYLVQRYKKQILSSSLNSSKTNNLRGYFLATFRGEKALIKILSSTKGDFVREERTAQSKIHQQLVTEAYTLRRLNSKPHPNILRVFAYDTSAQPYHLITELVSEGSLLQFLHSVRSRPEHMPVPSVLLEMMFGVIDALIFLNEQHLVHLSLMAANVLVSHDNVCKLTGFQFLREMTRQGGGRYFAYVSGDDEMATRHAAPECLENGHFSEHSVSWAIGVLLFEMHTYGVSPYNQYSNDQADQIRSHVIGHLVLKMEDCIRREVCEVIEMCLTYEKRDRPSLAQLRTELESIQKQIIEEEKDWPAAIYPPLTNVDLAQTKTMMISCNALEELDKEKNLGNFGSETVAMDRPTIRIFDGRQVIRELVSKEEADLSKLMYLKHENVVNFISLSLHDKKHVALVTEYSGLGNLLQTALAKKLLPEQLMTSVAQISKGLCYLHDNYMIHGDLRAEYIMVFPDNKVKVSRLGRSTPRDNLESKCGMPVDAERWSPPEVIKDGKYSRFSDVYSYGLLCYELFEALDAAEGSKPDDVKPFRAIADNQILEHLQGNNRPVRPNLMPIWLNIIIKTCLLDKPDNRPKFALITDALNSRKPFESYLLSDWVKCNKSEAENVDLNVTQSEQASHVIAKEHHKTFEELRQIVYDEIKEESAYEEIPAGGIYNRPPRLPRKPMQEPVLGFSELGPFPSLDDYENVDPIHEDVKQHQKAKKSLRALPSLPALPSSQQNTDKDPIISMTSSDEANHDAQVPSHLVQAPPASLVETVKESEIQYFENRAQEYISKGSNDLGATEKSCYSLTPKNVQEDGNSSSKPSVYSRTPKNARQDRSSLSETLDASKIDNIKARPDNSQPKNRPVPLPRTRLGKPGINGMETLS